MLESADCKGGGRPGEGMAYANLGNVYDSLGDFNKAIESTRWTWRLQRRWATGEGDYEKAIEYHGKHLAIAKEVGDRGRSRHTETWATRISRRGTMRRL